MITMMMMMLMGKVIVAEERMDGLHNKRWATALTSGTVPPYRPDHGFFVRWSVRPHQIVTTHIHTPICGENRKESDSNRVAVGQSPQSGVFCPITGLDTHREETATSFLWSIEKSNPPPPRPAQAKGIRSAQSPFCRGRYNAPRASFFCWRVPSSSS